MSDADACPRAEQVRRLVDSEFAAGELDTLHAHLGECGYCWEEHAALTRLSALLREGDSAPPPDAVRQTRRRQALLAACAATLPARASPSRYWERWRKPLAWALVPAAAGAFLLALNRPSRPTGVPAPPPRFEGSPYAQTARPVQPVPSGQTRAPRRPLQPQGERPVTSGQFARRPTRRASFGNESRVSRGQAGAEAVRPDPAPGIRPRSPQPREAERRWLELPTDRVVIHAEQSRPSPEPARESVSITAVGDPTTGQGSFVIIRSREEER